MDFIKTSSIVRKNFINNLITYTEYKYFVSLREQKYISYEDNPKYPSRYEINNNLITITLDVSNNKDGVSHKEFCYFVLDNITNKSINYISNTIEKTKEYIKSNNMKCFTDITFISVRKLSISEINFINSNIKSTVVPEQILILNELCVNYKTLLDRVKIEELTQSEVDATVNVLTLGNSCTVNTRSCDNNIHIKLFYFNQPIAGLRYTYSNPVTGKQVENRYYK